MELYPSGLMPAGRPFDVGGEVPDVPILPSVGAPASDPVLPPVGSDAPLSGNDMDFLERVLREFHLHDAAPARETPATSVAVGTAAAVATAVLAPAGAMLPGVPGAGAETIGSRCAPDASSTVGPWADALLHRLQASQSPEEARQRCVELLAGFANASGGPPATSGAASVQMEGRLRSLQGANSVLLRGFRSLYHKHQEAEARRQRAEEVCARMAAELARCQEQLSQSERAKGLLQYHLQLVSTGPSTAAGGM